MKILLDVCTPVQVRFALPGHEVRTAVHMGWGQVENGELLRLAEENGFDAFIISDKNLQYQQNLSKRQRMAIVELWTNHRPTLEKHFPLIRQCVEAIQPGQYLAIQPPR